MVSPRPLAAAVRSFDFVRTLRSLPRRGRALLGARKANAVARIGSLKYCVMAGVPARASILFFSYKRLGRIV
ncbi:hypothetical protein NXC14_PC00722 (plasmid) [Rhizobium sp. NXC14]|nr:hypothetical protein NXC14_PC00722 [Rhizobium sp. NXC14]